MREDSRERFEEKDTGQGESREGMSANISSVEISATPHPLKILYQDQDIVAIEKPPGMLVHRSPIDKHEKVFAVQTLRDQIGKRVFPAHRLDRPTSGVLLFAFDGQLAGELGQQMMQKQVHKTYHAVVRGFVHNTGFIDYALKYKYDKIADKHKRPQQPPQIATTVYESVACYEVPQPVGKYQSARYSLIKLSPSTGRKHQLRRHLAHIRHPIIGDTTHGDGKQNKFAKSHFSFNHLALNCTSMGFYHPTSQKWVTISSDFHHDMAMFIRRLENFRVVPS